MLPTNCDKVICVFWRDVEFVVTQYVSLATWFAQQKIKDIMVK